MQLVGGNVRVLRPGAGPDKTDLVVDAAKVEEIMGVPPEKVADVMALMGDSIDNIPGAKGIGEKGAKELIRRFGSAEAALERAKEVEGKRYREALENSREAVMMSKQLAVIDTDRAGEAGARRSTRERSGRGSPARALRGAGIYFAAARSARRNDCRARRGKRFRGARISRGAEKISERHSARRRNRRVADARRGRTRKEGFGSQVAAVEISPKPGVSRTAWVRRQGRNARRARRISARPRAAENRARPKARRAAGRPRRRNPPRDDAVFLPAAAHHLEAQPGRRGAAAGKRHALRRSRRACGTSAASRAAAAQGSRGAGPRGTVRDD